MSIVQRKLDFRVRKTTRSSAQIKKQIEEASGVKSPKHTHGSKITQTATPVKESSTPNRRTRSSRAGTPIKSTQDNVTTGTKVDDSSLNGLKPSVVIKSKVKQLSVESSVRSPRTKFEVQDEGSKVKQLSVETAIRSPRLTKFEAPDAGIKTTVAISRDLPISPLKRPLQLEGSHKRSKSPASPKKQMKKENCPTPVKNRPDGTNSERLERSPKLRLFRQNVDVYTKTRQALHTAQPDRLLCREREVEQIESFLSQHLSSETAGSLYISGAPGTGKTAVLHHLLHLYKDKFRKPIFINCMMMKSSHAIFNAILGQLQKKPGTAKTAKDAQRQIEHLITSSSQMILLVLDEIDQLDSKNQEVLYTMFEWPTLKNAQLVLIGIANALDLTDRILPRLQSRPKCRPKLINFPPYSKNQIVTILEDRLKQSLADGDCVMERHAVQFCARKVSAVAGDMRKALDVCRRAVEKIEVEVNGQQVLKPSVTNSPRKTPTKKPPAKVGVSHIAQVVSEVYSSKVTSSSGRQNNIPLQQKLIVCSLLVMLKHGKAKEVTAGKLHETFLKICKKRRVGMTDQSEFTSMISLLDTAGILIVKKAKEQRLAKVSMKLDEEEVEFALQDKMLVSTILAEGVPT